MTRVLLAVLVALVPGLAAWWTGRSLVRHADDAALPELLLARQQRLTGVAVVAGVAVALLSAWALPVLVLALLAGSWPLRRALFEERWSLGAYMAAQARALVGWTGPYLLLGLLPLLVLAAEPLHLPMALALGALLLLWLHRYAEGWRWGNLASPLERDDLRPLLDAVIARARVPMPALWRFGHPGSSLTNAVALPSLRAPGVAFSDRLLERLAPDEVAAVFAHEVAHLEHYDARRLKRMRLATWALAAIGAGVPVYAIEAAPALRTWLAWAWPVVVLVALARRSSLAQAHETESDRRAVELTGDPEALVRALAALHAWARLPRRWARDFERSASHPSLARRIRDIRAAGATSGGLSTDVAVPGALPVPGGATAAATGAMAPVVLQSSTAGRWVVLDAERAHWCDGVPAGTPPEPAALREGASRYRAVRYGDLTELRVAADAGARVLRAVDRDGQSWGVPLQPAEVARAQAALDQVDAALGAPASDRRRDDVVGRLVAAGIALAALLAGQFGLVLLPALLALVRPLPALLALAGGTAVARAALAFAEPEAQWAAVDERIALLLLLAIGAMAAWLAFRRRQERVTRFGMASLVAFVALAAGPLLVAGLANGVDWSAGAPAAITVAVALAGVATALLVMRGRSRRTAGVLALALGLPLAVLGLGTDRVRGREAGIAWASARATEVARVALPATTTGLQLSPSGARWAVRRYSAESYQRFARRGAWPFTVGDFGGARRETEAGDIQFVDEERLLALATLAQGTELRLEHAATGVVLHADTLPPMVEPQLWLDRAAGRWAVTGGHDEEVALVRADGSIGGGDVRVAQLESEGANLVSLVHRDGVSIVVPRRVATMLTGPLAILGGTAGFRSELWHVGPAGRRVVGDLGGWPRCAQAGIGNDGVCVITDGRRAALWHVDSSGARRLGALPALHVEGAVADGRWASASPTARGIVVVEPATRRGLRVSLGDGGYVTAVQPLRGGAGVLSVDGGAAALVLYRIEEPARATLAVP